MGAELPEEPPVIEDDKWYCCTSQDYRQVDGNNSCDNPFVASCTQCREGWDIKAWYDHGHECDDPIQIVLCWPFASQRITSIIGPFDSAALCKANSECTESQAGPHD